MPAIEQLFAVDETRRVEIGEKGFVHAHRLHELDVGGKAVGAQRFGRQSKLATERAGEGFMRSVTGAERHLEDVGGDPPRELGPLR